MAPLSGYYADGSRRSILMDHVFQFSSFHERIDVLDSLTLKPVILEVKNVLRMLVSARVIHLVIIHLPK